MGYKFNPFTGKLDRVGASQSQNDDRYVNVSGDTMTGILNMGTNAIRMTDGAATQWGITVATDGALVTTQVVGNPGVPYGLLLTLTQP